jgi:hypothetical protein
MRDLGAYSGRLDGAPSRALFREARALMRSGRAHREGVLEPLHVHQPTRNASAGLTYMGPHKKDVPPHHARVNVARFRSRVRRFGTPSSAFSPSSGVMASGRKDA